MSGFTIRGYRKSRGENQIEFWSRFGVTQSAASRYESNLNRIPICVAMLLSLYDAGKITDADLVMAAREIRRTRK